MGFFDFLKGSQSMPQPASASAVPQFRLPSDIVDINRKDYQQFGNRVGDAVLHLSLARSSALAGNMNQARISYSKAVESWRQANENGLGDYTKEHELTAKEYDAFVSVDPVYHSGLSSLLPVIQGNPGILQTDLYKACPSIERETVSYILYFAASKGVIERTKKGRTYEVRVK